MCEENMIKQHVYQSGTKLESYNVQKRAVSEWKFVTNWDQFSDKLQSWDSASFYIKRKINFRSSFICSHFLSLHLSHTYYRATFQDLSKILWIHVNSHRAKTLPRGYTRFCVSCSLSPLCAGPWPLYCSAHYVAGRAARVGLISAEGHVPRDQKPELIPARFRRFTLAKKTLKKPAGVSKNSHSGGGFFRFGFFCSVSHEKPECIRKIRVFFLCKCKFGVFYPHVKYWRNLCKHQMGVSNGSCPSPYQIGFSECIDCRKSDFELAFCIKWNMISSRTVAQWRS